MLGSAVPTISRDELEAAIRGRRITLVDVLSPESFAIAHLTGAINLPVAEIRRRAQPEPGRMPTMEDAFIAIVEEARAGEDRQGARARGAV